MYSLVISDKAFSYYRTANNGAHKKSIDISDFGVLKASINVNNKGVDFFV